MLRGILDLSLPDILTALQDHHAIADGKDVLKPMGNDDLGDAVPLELEHGFEQPFGSHDREIGGRLVENDHARLE